MFRGAVRGDLPQILKIYAHARAVMKASGNPTQWGDNFPPQELLEEDIDSNRLFLYVVNGQIEAVFAFILGADPTYAAIEDGEFVFLVGPSGSGKSTIIKMLTGEEVPTAGRIMINGFSVSNIAERQVPMMRRTLGVIFQDFRLIEKKTVYENLEFVMRAVGMPKKEIKQRITYVLQLVGLEKKAENFPSELSGGEQQRVAIARALVNNPATIIADEPTGNLDPERSMEIMTLLVKINQLGTTVVVVTHEKDLVNKFGKRVITIDQGRIINDSVGGYVGGHIHE